MRQLSQFERHQVSAWIPSKGSVRQRLRYVGEVKETDTGLPVVKREPPDQIATKWSAGQAFISTSSENQKKRNDLFMTTTVPVRTC